MSASSGPPQLMTPRNVVAFFLAITLMTGLAVGEARLVAVGVILLAVMLMSILDAWPLLGSVRVERHHPTRVFQNTALPVELRITSSGGRNPELLLVEDSIPPSSAYRQRRLVALPPGREHSLHLQFFPRCDHRRGIYVLGPVRLAAQDAFGFFRRVEIIDELSELVVYPESVELSGFPVLGDGTLEHVGLEVVPRRGVSEELFGTRDYAVGDSLRRVHWKLTARHQRLMVKEYKEELTTTVSVFLDLGRLGLSGVGDHTSVEYGIRVAASLLQRCEELGHRFQYFGVGSKLEHVGIGSGAGHLLAILDRLAFAKADGDSGYLAIAQDLLPTLPRGSTMVLIFGYTTSSVEALRAVIVGCSVRRILPIVCMVDDRAFIKLFREQETQHAAALSPEELRRDLQLLGAHVYLVTRQAEIAHAIDEALGRHPERVGR